MTVVAVVKKGIDVSIHIKIPMDTDTTKITDVVLIFHTVFADWN